ncbi:sugar phosphate nucleotidyltransferase [Petrachloros mirabilis]
MPPPHVWSIILAGGNGTRLNPTIKRWLGEVIPKQYCTFTGSRSMLEHTIDRAMRLSPPAKVTTVVTRGQEPYAQKQAGLHGDSVIVQPANRDTAAGILLPLTYVRDQDAKGTVVVYPADHFVYPEEAFANVIRKAALAVEMMPERIVLLGVKPDRIEMDYGWITLSEELGCYGKFRIWKVGNFVEKPTPAVQRSLCLERALWNTMILVGKVDTIWKLGWKCLPSTMRQFELFQQSIGSDREEAVLETLYRVMSARNFSKDILEQAPDHMMVMEMEGIAWNDWGRADRITESLRQIGKTPDFHPALTGFVGVEQHGTAMAEQ